MTGARKEQDSDGAPAHPQDRLQIEFFGLPGSGKTTVARELHALMTGAGRDFVFAGDLLHDRGRPRQRIAAKAQLVLSALGRGRGAGLGSLVRAFRVPQPRFRDRLRSASTVATVASLNHHLQRRRLDAILDQGTLQSLWTVQLRSPNLAARTLIDEILGAVPLSGRVFVSVETSPDICATRLQERDSKHSRLQSSDLKGNLETWDRAEFLRRNLLRDLRSEYERRNLSPLILTVEGTLPPRVAAQQIAKLLQ